MKWFLSRYLAYKFKLDCPKTIFFENLIFIQIYILQFLAKYLKVIIPLQRWNISVYLNASGEDGETVRG